MKKLKFIIWVLWNLLPKLWKIADNKYVDVGTFWCNEDATWKEYKKVKQLISILITETPEYDFTGKSNWRDENIKHI